MIPAWRKKSVYFKDVIIGVPTISYAGLHSQDYMSSTNWIGCIFLKEGMKFGEQGNEMDMGGAGAMDKTKLHCMKFSKT